MENKKASKTKWKITDNRFVAFIDILGFKDLVMRNSHKKIYDQLKKLSKMKNLLEAFPNESNGEDFPKDAEINIINFSDSIIIFSKNDNIDNFRYFTVAVGALFADAIKNEIPLKGGVALGEISLNNSDQIYFGQAIIDAYLIEEDVNYFGIVAHNSIDKYFSKNKKELKDDFFEKVFFEIETPLKSGQIEHRNLDWFQMVGEGNSNNKEFLENLIKSFKTSISGSPRKYLDNTLSVINNRFSTSDGYEIVEDN